jgi:hypothetical protein
VADKYEYVDLISMATRQRYRPRRVIPHDIVEPDAPETSRLAHRSARMERWRLENLTPWKLKSWKFVNWD